MENYKLLQRLGKGAQGSVYLVENRHDGLNYVLKKVECNDESEANKAFKEAMALQELRHQFVPTRSSESVNICEKQHNKENNNI